MANEPSRPRLTTTAPKPHTSLKQIGIRVPARMNDQLEAIAKRENNGVSAVVRRLLAAALAPAHGDEAA